MPGAFFSKQNNSSHSKECLNFTENSLKSCVYGIECICKNCSCHYCSYQNNSEYRKKYLIKYFSQGVFKN